MFFRLKMKASSTIRNCLEIVNPPMDVSKLSNDQQNNYYRDHGLHALSLSKLHDNTGAFANNLKIKGLT